MPIIKKCKNYLKQKRKNTSRRTVRATHNCNASSKSNGLNKNSNYIDTFVNAIICSETTFCNTMDSCLKNKEEKTFSILYSVRGG